MSDSLVTNIVLLSLVFIILQLCLLVVILTWYTVRLVTAKLEEKNQPATQEVLTPSRKLGFWQRLDRTVITAATPIEREEDILLDHNYDGIRELDNHLPPWWKGLLYGTIGFSAIYLLIFHVYSWWPLQLGEYEAEVEQAKVELAAYQAKAADAIDETNVTATTDAKAIADAKVMFAENCRACHGAEGQGGVGPNLTDLYWLHGGDVKDIFKTIKNGVPEKGMVSWKAKFKPSELRSLASYILTMQGTNPAGRKAPQGEKFEPKGGSDAAPKADSTAVQHPVAMQQ